MTRRARLRLPGQTTLGVEFFGKVYVAWLERWTRRAWNIAGEVSFAAHLVIAYDRGRRERNHAEKLKKRLWRWGYRVISLQARPRAKEAE